jgi:hypothetical protein
MSFETVGRDGERVGLPLCIGKAMPSMRLMSLRQFASITPRYEVTDSRGERIAKGRFELG